MTPHPPKPAPNLLPHICGIALVYYLVAITLFDGPSLLASYVCVVLLSLRSSRTWHIYFAAVLGTAVLGVQLAQAPANFLAFNKVIAFSMVLCSLWGTALLGSATVHRARKEATRLAEYAIDILQAERLAAAAEGSNIWLWEADHRGRPVWDMNPPVSLELNALPDAAARWRGFMALVAPEEVSRIDAQMVEAVRSKATQIALRYKVSLAGKGQLHFLTRAHIYYTPQGQPLRTIGATTDVTEEVHRTELLQQQVELQQTQHQRIKIAARAAGLWMWERDARSHAFIWDENRPAEFSLDDVAYHDLLPKFSQLIAPEDVKQLRDEIDDATACGSEIFTVRYRTRTPGSDLLRHREAIGHIEYDAERRPRKLIGITRDITNEVQTHEMIQREAQYKDELSNRLNVAIETAGLHCWQARFPGPTMVWSQNAVAELGPIAHGLSMDELVQAAHAEVHPQDLPLLTTETEHALAQGREARDFRFRRIKPDGSMTYFHAYHRYHYDRQQRPTLLVGVTINVTQQHQAAEQIRKQKEELELLHNRMERAAISSQEGHWEVNLATGAHWASASYRALLGYPPDFDLSTIEHYHSLIHPDDLVRERQEELRLHIADTMFTQVKRLRHANGEWRWMQANGSLERDESGRPVRMTGSIRNVHEQKIAEERLLAAQERFNRAINGTQDGLWEIDLMNEKMWLSPRYSELLGYDPAETSHWSVSDLDRITHPDDLAISKQQRQRTFDCNWCLDFEHRIGTKGGEWIWVRVRGTVERDAQDNPVRVAGSMSNVTEAHLAHDQLLQATEQAQEANRAKSAFLANMSHEIRTPMNGIIGMTGLLLDTELDRTQIDFAETIRSSADSLLGIINDILDFSKIEAGKLDIEMLEMDLRSNVEDVGAMLGFQAASKNLELIINVHPDIPERLIGDPQRIRQCLINLLGNAIKFTRQGEVVIEVSQLQSQHLGPQVEQQIDATHIQLRFDIRDSGIGISPEALDNLFKPFTQADSSTTRQYGGTGLGLSIVKRLIELMGGTVGATSSYGQGSTFWFTLPLKLVQQQPDVLNAPHPANHGKRILIVDDNDTNRRVLSLQLVHLGYLVSIADSGAAALQELQRELAIGRSFDIVLTDFQMPDMDGAMLGERINGDPRLTHTHLMLLTSMDRHGDAQRFAAMGFAAYLTKPVRVRELRDALQRVLARDVTGRGKPQPLITRNAIQEQIAAERFNGEVLLVDDNIVNQKVAGRFLERMGLIVTIANDGAEAVTAFTAQHFNIVFMDLQMPVMDGFEATRRIRDFEGWRPRTPIIALTANAMAGQMERCLASGMDGFVTKPIHVEQLREIVAKYCVNPAATPETSDLDGQMTATLLETDSAVSQRILNIEQFKELAGGDVDFARELAQAFITSAQQILADFKSAQALNDRSNVCRIAHKLKGASATIHAEQVRNLCEQLESHGLDLAPDVLAALLVKLEHSTTQVVGELGSLLDDNQSAA